MCSRVKVQKKAFKRIPASWHSKHNAARVFESEQPFLNFENYSIQ